jgi:hypothetical protein
MTGKFSDGFDWLPAGLTSSGTSSNATINGLMQARGYYLRGSRPGLLVGANTVTGRFNYGLRFHMIPGSTASDFQAVVKPIAAQNSTGGYVSAGWNIQGTNTRWPFFGVYDLVNDVVLCSVQFQPNGVVAAWRGLPGSGSFLGASDIYTYYNNVDIDVEAFFKVHNTAGEIEVRINTISVLHLVSVDTQPGAIAYFDGVCWGDFAGSGQVTNYYIDDFRYYDTAGSINNGWLGTNRVQTSLTAGAGAHTSFSRINPSFANWQNARNQAVDDTLYVYSPTVGDYDLYTIDPLVNSPTVFWVQVTSFVRQDDATQLFFKNRISSSGTIADGASFATSQSYAADSDVFELNPNTGLTFTGAQVNALQIGPLLYASN